MKLFKLRIYMTANLNCLEKIAISDRTYGPLYKKSLNGQDNVILIICQENCKLIRNFNDHFKSIAAALNPRLLLNQAPHCIRPCR